MRDFLFYSKKFIIGDSRFILLEGFFELPAQFDTLQL